MTNHINEIKSQTPILQRNLSNPMTDCIGELKSKLNK